MTARSDGLPASHETRRRILRRASYYTISFISTTLAVAAAGSALIAWFLTLSGLPFRATWIALMITVLAVPPLGMAVGALRKRWRRARGAGESDESGGSKSGSSNGS
jgi:ABC-type Fe3+ transport system permease subunit